MASKIGELFFDLGVTGSEKSIGAVAGLRSGLKDTASMGLETKAAIVGALYAVEQLFSASGRVGTSLTNANAVIGMQTQDLQRYGYALMQVGGTVEEMTGTFGALQQAMADIQLGGKAPAGLAQLSHSLQDAGLGGIGRDDIDNFAKHPEELLKRLQQYANLQTIPQDVKNSILKTFPGISGNVLAGLDRNAFRPDVLARAPVYTDRQVGALDKSRAAFGNLNNNAEMMIGRLNAQFGEKLANQIDHLIPKVEHLIGSFIKLADKLHIFEVIGKAFEGWGMIFDMLAEANDEQLKKNGPREVPEALKGLTDSTQGVNHPKSDAEATTFLLNMISGKSNSSAPFIGPPNNPALTAPNVTVNNNQTFNGNGTDPREARRIHDSTAKDAYRQLPQGQRK